MAYNTITKDKIAAQALEEINFARIYKQGKIKNWKLNEAMYYGEKPSSIESRANVELGRMQEFVHTLLSKIDNPLLFKFTKRKNSQLKRVELLNSLRATDQDRNDWDIKDIAGKKQSIIYGRAIYSYFADSINKEYQPHLDPVDVYDFLIDPSGGGIDIEKAFYMGDYSLVMTKKDLEDGAKNGTYLKDKVRALITEGSGNASEVTQEVTNQLQRSNNQNTFGQKEKNDPSKYRFWRWFTTFQDDNERYYLVIDNNGRYIKCEKLTSLFSPTKYYPKGAWPYWTWAAFLDLTEFWTPSFCDYARDIFTTQNATIGQMLDNAEAINKPQKLVNVSAIENLAELKYRRDGQIKVKSAFNVNDVYQTVQTPSIDTPLKVFEALEKIQQKASGVTDQTSGIADTDGRVGIYEGNQIAEADRFGLLNKSYAFGYKRFARLYEAGVRENLLQKTAIEILGPNGVEVKNVKRSDLFKKNDEFGLIVEASNAQFLASNAEKKTKITFLQNNANNTNINQKKNFEMQARIAGFDEDSIKQLQDISFYGNSELMSECERDIECLLEGDDIKPNQAANNAYKQKMVSYLRDHEEDITFEQFKKIEAYITSLEPIIMRNEAKQLNDESNTMLDQGTNDILGGKVTPNAPAKQSSSVDVLAADANQIKEPQ